MNKLYLALPVPLSQKCVLTMHHLCSPKLTSAFNLADNFWASFFASTKPDIFSIIAVTVFIIRTIIVHCTHSCYVSLPTPIASFSKLYLIIAEEHVYCSQGPVTSNKLYTSMFLCAVIAIFATDCPLGLSPSTFPASEPPPES